jgi:hypothetical protein
VLIARAFVIINVVVPSIPMRAYVAAVLASAMACESKPLTVEE